MEFILTFPFIDNLFIELFFIIIYGIIQSKSYLGFDHCNFSLASLYYIILVFLSYLLVLPKVINSFFFWSSMQSSV